MGAEPDNIGLQEKEAAGAKRFGKYVRQKRTVIWPI